MKTAYQAAIRMQSLKAEATNIQQLIESPDFRHEIPTLISMRNRIEAQIDYIADKLCAIKYE